MGKAVVEELPSILGAAFDHVIDTMRMGNVSRMIGSQPQFEFPFFQQGGVMPHTGLAYLHEGERVIPAGDSYTDNSFSPVIYANIGSGYDVRNLARDLNEHWRRERR